MLLCAVGGTQNFVSLKTVVNIVEHFTEGKYITVAATGSVATAAQFWIYETQLMAMFALIRWNN
jgi:hypothetical protein